MFGIADHLFIVFANDVADEQADRMNPSPTLVSGGSRVLSEELLSRASLVRGAWGAFGLTCAFTLALAHHGQRASVLVLGLSAILLLASYSFQPLRLSYRGGGEVLQGLGVGVVLPALGYMAQAGTWDRFDVLWLSPPFLVGCAGNVLTALPDAPADALACKRTLAVRLGVPAASWVALLLLLAALLAFAFHAGPMPLPRRAQVALPSLGLLALSLGLRRPAVSLAKGAVLAFVFAGAATGLVLVLAWAWAVQPFF
jgi:1,4-dihydroxy-2-naphthoate octaprenyltransferase